MTAYNSIDFDPPAPVAYVTLKHPATNVEWTDVPMQLDSGADVTLIPQAAVNRLGLIVISDIPYELTGFDGATSQAFAVELKLTFCRRTFRGRFLLSNRPIGILGRDILNLIPLLLDGPRLEWSDYRAK
jgi:Retroviral aspartyl protease